MATDAASQPGADSNVDLDIINFDASDSAAVPWTESGEKHEATDNEIDWDDKVPAEDALKIDIAASETQNHIAVPEISTESKADVADFSAADESEAPATTEMPVQLSAATTVTDNSVPHVPAEDNEISYDLDIETEQVTATAEVPEVEENEIDYEEHIDDSAAQQDAAAVIEPEIVTTDAGDSFSNDVADAEVLDIEPTETQIAEHEEINVLDVDVDEAEKSQPGAEPESALAEDVHSEDEEGSQEYADHDETGDATIMVAEDEDGFPTSMQEPDITVRYSGQEYPLFHGQNNIDTQMGFFHDTGVLDAPMDDVFSSFRNELSDDLDETDELVLQIDDLGLQYAESTNPDILSSVTLRQLYNVLLKLAQNQDPDAVPTMYTFLNTRLNSTRRLSFLLQEAYSGSSLDSVAHRFPEEQSNQDSPDADEEMEDAEDDDEDDDDNQSEDVDQGEDGEQEHEEDEEEEDEEEDDDEEDEEEADVDGDEDHAEAENEVDHEAEGEEEEEEEEEEDEIPADDLEVSSHQVSDDRAQYAHNEVHHEVNPDEYLDFAGTHDNDHAEEPLMQGEVGDIGGDELYLEHTEDGGVGVEDGLDFALNENVATEDIDIAAGFDVPIDTQVDSFDATDFAAGDIDVGAELDNFDAIDTAVEDGTADSHASAVSSATEHGDEITYDEDEDANAGVSLEIGEASAPAADDEVNDQGKRPRSHDGQLEEGESDAKRICA